MAGGNPAAMAALMGAMPDQYAVHGSGSGSGTSLTALLNSLRDPNQEEAYKSLLNREEEAYKYSLKDWEKTNEQAYKEHWAKQLASTLKGMMGDQGGQSGLLNMQGLSPDMQAALQMATQLGGSANPLLLDSMGKILEQTQGQFLDNGAKTEDVRTAEAIQQSPGIMDIVKNLSTEPTAAEKYADALGLQGEDRRQFIWDQANKSQGGVTVNMGNGQQGPMVNVLPTETKRTLGLPENTQYVVDKNGMPQAINPGNETANKTKQQFDTMSNAAKRLDKLETEVPDYNPAEFTDAMLRSLASDDSSLVGKVLGPMQSPASKAYGTAAAEWVSANRAILSGAEVPETEFMRDLNVYFAKPGDTPEILAMKRQMRAQRIESLKSITQLPPEQRAAAWKATGDADQYKLTGISTEKGAAVTKAIGEATGAPPAFDDVVKEYETRKGKTLTPEEKAKAKAKYDAKYGAQ